MNDYDKILHKIEDKIGWVNPPQYNTYRVVEKCYWKNIPRLMWIDAQQNKENINNVIDIGSGYGTLALFAKEVYGANITSIDLNPVTHEEWLKSMGLNRVIMDIEETELPSVEGGYDRVIFTEVFEHLRYNPIPLLKDIKEVMADNGIMFFSTPNSNSWGRVTKYYSDWKEMPEFDGTVDYIPEHVYQYNWQELSEIFWLAGLKVVDVYSSISDVGFHFNLKIMKG
jgi:cyclopropane fatty-acyl-phospholipid synthase-like methyltransferase